MTDNHNNTDSPAGIADGERIAEIESRLSKIGEKNWFYNGYSQVCRDVGHDGYVKHDDLRDVAEQLFEKHGSCSTEFVHARYEAHQADPSVCFVPAEAGDTASGVHADTAEFIANSPGDIEWLIARLKRAEAERDAWRLKNTDCANAPTSVGHLTAEKNERIKQLESERDRLRSALEPWVKCLDGYHPSLSDDYGLWDGTATLGDLRRAAAALADAGNGGGE